MSSIEDPKERGATRVLLEANSAPILCSFPGGLPAALQNNSTHDLPNFVYNCESSSKTSLFGQDDACYYAATVSDEDQSKQSVKYLVGLFDKQQQTLTLSQAACNGAVFALSQSVRNYQKHTESSTEARLSLVQDFTSAKKQKVLRSQAANRVKADSVVGSGKLLMNGVQQTMSESNQIAMAEGRDQQQNVAIQQATEAWRSDFLPPFDTTATEASKVYRAKKIVSKDSWKQAGRVVDACSRKIDVAAAILDVSEPTVDAADDSTAVQRKQPTRKWFKTLETLVERLCNESSDDLDKERLQCAILVNHFASLYECLESRRFFPSPAPDRPRYFGIPIEFATFFVNKFTTLTMDMQGNEGHVMSKTDKDRCLVHMMILFVIADSGSAMRTNNVKSLLDDLKQDSANGMQLLRQAGFTVERKAGTTVSTVFLKVPLAFPSGIRKRAIKGR